MTAAARKFDSVDLGTTADELAPGTKLLFGQFTIESFVNSGGFGIVYIARDSLDRQVVIKECFPSTFCRRIGSTVGARSRAQQDEFRASVKSFMQEAVTLSQLNHPNIIKVHHVFEDNETAYMAMDYIDGPDLLQTVEGTARPLTPKEIVSFLHTMLDALGHVHERGLLHRDISPDNMILNKASGQPILIDFGASRKEVTRKSRALSGLRVVKDGYSPQEFYVSGSKQAPCSDLYALAASFYHLITGETPKTSQERLSAIAGREGDPLRPLAGRFKTYPRGFLDAIDKAMAIFPRDRLQSVDDWRSMLTGDAARPVSEPVVPAASVARAVSAPPHADVAPAALPPVAPQQAKAPSVPVAPEPAVAASPAPIVVIQAPRNVRDFLMSSAAAVLLLVGLLSLPNLLSRGTDGVALPATASTSPTETLALVVPTPAEPAPRADELLPVTNVLRLPGGYTFDVVETPTATQTVVSELPAELQGSIQVGDILLVYAPTGETLATATALRAILQREFANGITTYSFVVRRGDSTVEAEFRLGVAG
ncbi:serine/threonine protein kinase [Tabrizicola sp.]|uniref:serine/threonine protein kinase n=1 Tax=Tabrizicola sp. TaxID=2005166 RepID=UPI00273607CD|nr:serine/threonine protein kinase [Tabrizicola sp.]MDP3196864.1 protein kinase [Tabrizicola sp.]